MEWSGTPRLTPLWVSGLIYARPKGGKSRLVGSAGALGPVLVWDFDYNFPLDAFPKGTVAVEHAADYREYRNKLLKYKPGPGGKGVEYEGHLFYSIVKDSLSGLYPLILDDVLKLPMTKEAGRKMDMQQGDSAPEFSRGRELATITDFGLANARLEDLVRLHRQLPCHFFAVAHEEVYDFKDAGDQAGKREVNAGPRAGISLTNKLNVKIPRLFNMWLRIKVENPTSEAARPEHYKVYSVQSDYYFPAGDAFGKLDPVEPSDLAAIIRKVGGYAPESA